MQINPSRAVSEGTLLVALTLAVVEVAATVQAAPGIALGLVRWQGQRGPQKSPRACPGEASGMLLCQLAVTESCCASQPAQLQHYMTWLINQAPKHSTHTAASSDLIDQLSFKHSSAPSCYQYMSHQPTGKV